MFEDLATWGSHDPPSKFEIEKRRAFQHIANLLAKKGCTIDKINEDGNCLFAAVARQVYGQADSFQKVRDETVEYIISQRSFFSAFEIDIDGRLSKQLMNGVWGGNMEIAAISELYDVGIKVWELGSSGELISTFDNTPEALPKGLKTLWLVRHRGVHYDSVIRENQKLPLFPAQGLTSKVW